MVHKRSDAGKQEQNARRVSRRKRRQRQLYEVIRGLSALRDQRDRAQEELRRTLQVAEEQATAALLRTAQLHADVQQRVEEVSQLRTDLADATTRDARLQEELTMARASLRDHLASRERFTVLREEQAAQIQALMQTQAEQVAAAERHQRELHAVRAEAADTDAEYALLQAAHRDLLQEHHDLTGEHAHISAQNQDLRHQHEADAVRLRRLRAEAAHLREENDMLRLALGAAPT